MSNLVNFQELQKAIGYKSGLTPTRISRQYLGLANAISHLPENKATGLEPITISEVLAQSKAFYTKYFNLHNIPVNQNITNEVLSKITRCQVSIDALNTLTAQTIVTSPYELPISIVDGHSMIGDISKLVAINPNTKESIGSPFIFFNIKLGQELTKLSIPTHIHEIAHSQTESIIGYAESYLNKEVISIFLEKVSAKELDHTGKLLLTSERMRYRHLLEQIVTLYLYYSQPNTVDEQSALMASMYITSILKAEKLFDIYINSRKQKEKDRIMSSIQDVFEGKITVEELLNKYSITEAQGCDLNLTKRHI